jgi:hypothetical protein
MRRDPQQIQLGAETWYVRPLTLAQVRDIEPILIAQGAGGTVAAAMEVIAVALARDNPAAVETLPALEATAPEVAAALAVVLKLGGFIAPDAAVSEASPQGEALAGVPTDTLASASTTLSPAS